MVLPSIWRRETIFYAVLLSYWPTKLMSWLQQSESFQAHYVSHTLPPLAQLSWVSWIFFSWLLVIPCAALLLVGAVVFYISSKPLQMLLSYYYLYVHDPAVEWLTTKQKKRN